VCAEAARAAAAALEGLGHEVVPVDLTLPDEVLPAFLNIVNTGLADYPGVDWARAEPHIQAARAAAQGVDSLTYVASVHELQRFTRSTVGRWGAEFDVLVTPTMTIEPPRAGEVLAATSMFNVSGQPAVSLPCHRSPSGLPIGVQVVAGPFEEARLLRVASQLEQALPWAGLTPIVPGPG
jgi:amidase